MAYATWMPPQFLKDQPMPSALYQPHLLPAPLMNDSDLARRQVKAWTLTQLETLAAFCDDPTVEAHRKRKAVHNLDVARSAVPSLRGLIAREIEVKLI
jgi:hypothetical protein